MTPAANLHKLRQRDAKFIQLEELREFRNKVRVKIMLSLLIERVEARITLTKRSLNLFDFQDTLFLMPLGSFGRSSLS